MQATGFRAWTFAAVAIALTAIVAPRAVRAQSALEYGVKANYLVRFAAFVEWPPQAFSDGQAPVVICVVGRDPFGGALTQAARSQTAFGRPLVISDRSATQGVAGCHIVYVGAGGDPMLAAAADQPALWVTDGTVSSRRGMIHFVIDRDRVRFHIDQRAAAARRLSINSRLLDLALTVRAVGR